MDEKSGRKFLRYIFNPTHHFVLLCLDFLAVRMAFVSQRCGGKFGWSVVGRWFSDARIASKILVPGSNPENHFFF